MRSDTAAPRFAAAGFPLAETLGGSSILLVFALLLFYGFGSGVASVSAQGVESFDTVSVDLPSDARDDIDPCLPQSLLSGPQGKPVEPVGTSPTRRPVGQTISCQPRAPPFI